MSIFTLLKQFYSLWRPVTATVPRHLFVPVALVAAGFVINVSFGIAPVETKAVFGGPEPVSAPIASLSTDVVASNVPDDVPIAQPGDSVAGFVILDSSAALDATSPLAALLPGRNGLITYKIQPGDTLSGLAAEFGISVNTILWANQGIRANALRVGQEVVILPVAGVLHRVQEGDSVDSLAAFYTVSAERILKFNSGITRSSLGNLTTIIVPDAKPRGSSSVVASGLPSYPGYFAFPTIGWNWGQLHGNNAVDIANACGTPIYAAAEGLVLEAAGGWNGGYGRMVVIEHPNTTKTRYAHLQEISVEVGNYVGQGDSIGTMGNTGYVHGPTGCHLHFEALGFRNWLAK